MKNKFEKGHKQSWSASEDAYYRYVECGIEETTRDIVKEMFVFRLGNKIRIDKIRINIIQVKQPCGYLSNNSDTLILLIYKEQRKSKM